MGITEVPLQLKDGPSKLIETMKTKSVDHRLLRHHSTQTLPGKLTKSLHTKSRAASNDEMVPYIKIDHPFHLKNDLKFAFTYCNESASVGSSVCSGLRNSLLSSFSSLSYDYDNGMLDSSNSSEGSEEDLIDQRAVQEFPSWRLSPEESKSDWTIVVESVPEGTVSKYHVHKEVLIHNGRKSSDYFSRIFGDILNQKVYKYKTIKIHEDAAKLIETMLDYMYSVQDRLLLTSESAVGLRHLSQFFGIEALAKRVSAFIHEDIELSNMDIYMDTTAAFDDLETIMLCADRCAEEIEDIHPLSQMVVEMDPSFGQFPMYVGVGRGHSGGF